ncbi:MAG: helix-turn-helix transcriptional regulator [Methanomassiliicoccaceae archaeon]|nr:helix-turn-helix transcriptional regulator [Methanomassiliicoccaceae archaeon]
MYSPRSDCAIDATMSLIEGRWKSVLLCKLNQTGEMRFNQLLKNIDGISPRMLTKQLKELERDGLIAREAYHEIPPRVEYSLTEKGKSLLPVLQAMAQWGLDNMFTNVMNIDGGGAVMRTD